MGTPKVVWVDETINFIFFQYNNAFVSFDKTTGKVNGWDNAGLLKVQKYAPDPTALAIKPGYTQEEVLKYMGTPDTVTYEVSDGKLQHLMWVYGNNTYMFDVN